jgi:hypothetical protein
MTLQPNLAVAFEKCLAWLGMLTDCGFLSSELMAGRGQDHGGVAYARVKASYAGREFLVDVVSIPHVPQKTFDREWGKIVERYNAGKISMTTLRERWMEGNGGMKLLAALADKGFPIATMKARPEWLAQHPKEVDHEDRSQQGDVSVPGGSEPTLEAASGAVRGADPAPSEELPRGED